jgi:5-methylcytosine-specific restriction endonuclease McrA
MAQRRAQIPFPEAPRGVCRWCGDAILLADGPYRGERDIRRRWHPPCQAAWEQSDPREAQRRVYRRDQGHCAACGLDTEAERDRLGGRRRLRDFGKPRIPVWRVDLIVPLDEGGTFDLANFQTLCNRCHDDKLARQTNERLEREREQQAEALMARAEVLLDVSRRLVGHLRDATGEIIEQRAGELGEPPEGPAQITRKSE